MTKDEAQLAIERVVQICSSLPSPDDAFNVLGMAGQIMSCMAEESRDAAIARFTSCLQHAQKQLAVNYDTYVWAIKEADKIYDRPEPFRRKVEAVVVWFDSEPPPANKVGDKTKH